MCTICVLSVLVYYVIQDDYYFSLPFIMIRKRISTKVDNFIKTV